MHSPVLCDQSVRVRKRSYINLLNKIRLMPGCNSGIQVRFSNRSDNPERIQISRKTDSDGEGRISFCMAENEEVEEASEANDDSISTQSALTNAEDVVVVEGRSTLLANAPQDKGARSSRSEPGSRQHQHVAQTIKFQEHSSATADLMAVNRRRESDRKAEEDSEHEGPNLELNILFVIVSAVKELMNTGVGVVRRTLNGYRKIPSLRVRMLVASSPIFIFLFLPNFLSGLLVGTYLSWALFFHFCVSPIPNNDVKPPFDEEVFHDVCIKSEEEDKTGRIYKGWMNILNEHYHPHRFHVNTLQTVLVRLDGNLLRISRPNRSLLKHAFHNDPTLTEPEPRMLSQNIYDLTNASVKLRPRRLARRRWFSRKYPICVQLAAASKCTESHSPSADSTMLRSKRPSSLRRHTMRPIESQPCRTETNAEGSNSKSTEFAGTEDHHSTRKCRNSISALGSATSLVSYSTVSTVSDNVIVETHSQSGIVTADNVRDLKVSPAKEAVTDSSLEEGDDSIASSSSDDELTNVESQRIGRSISEFGVATSRRNRACCEKRKNRRRLFLFARSSREKERWFHRLRKATSKYLLENSAFENVTNNADNVFTEFVMQSQNGESREPWTRRRVASMPALKSGQNGPIASKNYLLYILTDLQFSKHIEDILPGSAARKMVAAGHGNGIAAMDLGRNKWKSPENQPQNNDFIGVVNLLASRIFYDFCRDEYWIGAVQKKIQTKLATIHLPHFIETLELSSFDIGTAIPRILNVYPAIIDDWGIWIDFEVKYEGRIRLMIETKVNLMKLKQHDAAHCYPEDVNSPGFSQQGFSSGTPPPTSSLTRREPSRYSDDEIPESPETSPDEEFGSKLRLDEFSSRHKKKSGQKFLNFVDKIAQSKYFKEATDLKPIRKMMEEISSTRLILNVEVTGLEGIMTANLPTPPSDRLWYGFRKPPKMSVRAVPQVGDHFVAVSVLSDWIESKIKQLLEKNLVVPNLDDVVIPVQSGNILLQGGLNL